MTGMIKKDIMLVFSNKKILLMLVLFYLGFGLLTDTDMGGMLPFIVVMLNCSTSSYDEFYNWYAYSAAMPRGREMLVKSKYISMLLLVLASILICIPMSLIIQLKSGNLDVVYVLLNIGAVSLITIITGDLVYPIIFKMGVDKGRLMLMVVWLAFFALVFMGFKYIEVSDEIFVKALAYAIAATAVIGTPISYMISKKIYSKKEL